MNFEQRQQALMGARSEVYAVDDWLRQRRGISGLVTVDIGQIADDCQLPRDTVSWALDDLDKRGLVTWSPLARVAFVCGTVLDTCDGSGLQRLMVSMAGNFYPDCPAKHAMDAELDAALLLRRKAMRPNLTLLQGGK